MSKHTLELFLALIMAGAVAVLGGAPLLFVQNSRRGDIVLVQHVTLHTNSSTGSALWNGTVPNECTCRNMCWAKTGCVTLSYNTLDKRCILSDKMPHECFFTSSPGSFVAYHTSSFTNQSYTPGPDGYLYVVPNFVKNFDEAKSTCARIPSHRLAIFLKMSQYNVLEQIRKQMGGNPEIWVDMVSLINGPRWGDGTYYTNSELAGKVQAWYTAGNMFAMRTNMNELDDQDPKVQLLFICQADPTGMRW
ncbi:uncharacterized protein LOC135204931 [Macrobrachium nipponense]|uniref:uncharacterized protein LOC135204931 n=1 Tax=Macrobrachium nipponense TaxID=159736 RepID=UPI0030C7E915